MYGSTDYRQVCCEGLRASPVFGDNYDCTLQGDADNLQPCGKISEFISVFFYCFILVIFIIILDGLTLVCITDLPYGSTIKYRDENIPCPSP